MDIRRGLIVLLFLIPLSLFSSDRYTYFDIGNMGVEFNFNNSETVDYLTIALPTLFLREYNANLGLSILTAEIKLPLDEIYSLIEADFQYKFLETSLFWSPIDIKYFTILGPFIDISLTPLDSNIFDSRFGIKAVYGKSSIELFKNSLLPREMVLTSFDLEVGYSIKSDMFYLNISSDFSIIIDSIFSLFENPV